MISAIIPTHNRAWCVREAVESVLAQRGAEVECIVVDDGSTDGTRELLADLPIRYVPLEGAIGVASPPSTLRAAKLEGVQERGCREVEMSNMEMRPLRLPLGPAAARNHGIAEARGEFIAFLDSDDLWTRDKCARQERYLRDHPECLLVHCNERWVRNGEHLNQGKRHARGGGDQFGRSLELCCISPSSVMVRRELFDRVGPFDEAAQPCEDYDLWLRVTARFPVGFLPDVMVVKRGGHADQLTRLVPNLDYYRIMAIGRLLASGILSDVQATAARRELNTKVRIYRSGLDKRGRAEERRELDQWLSRIPGR
jgi:glycosyltransferase involved in cell wall biosynthesis